jgi:hypothetical protein
MVADFRRFYGLDLSSMREWGLPLADVADLAVNLPPEGSVHRAINPHWQRSMELDLIRQMEWDIRMLLRQGSGQRNSARYPDPIPLPWDPPPEGTVQGDKMTFEDADKFLGWDKLKADRARKAAEHGD